MKLIALLFVIGAVTCAPLSKLGHHGNDQTGKQLDQGNFQYDDGTQFQDNLPAQNDFQEYDGGVVQADDVVLTDERDGPVGADFRYLLETQAGTRIEQQGEAGQNGGQVLRGSYSYVAPNGETVEVTYIADENGYQPQSDRLPVAPPIPPHAQALIEMAELQRANQPDTQYDQYDSGIQTEDNSVFVVANQQGNDGQVAANGQFNINQQPTSQNQFNR